MNKLRKEIVAILAIVLIVSVGLTVYIEEPFTFTKYVSEINLDIPNDNFTQFALLVTIGYDMLPTVAQQFSIGAITVQLLMTGFSPILFGIISAFALLVGQMILYLVGMFVRRIHTGNFGNIAPHNHWLHKYHFLVFLTVPFLGLVGDGAMLYSGHQKINPLKMIPFLLIANFASTMRWILPTLAELELTDVVQNG
jgi:hypothetical protein